MEKILFEAVKPYLIDNPVLVIVLIVLVSFFKWKIAELSGWIALVERDLKASINEVRDSTRDGLKEERTYRHDVITEQDKRIHELTKEVSELLARRRT